ncbi:MAG: spermidine synthase, partial [Nitrospirae bacterium]
YKDKIIYEKQTKYQKIVITQWKQYYWLFINKNIQFSTYDEYRYHEPLVHPAMSLVPHRENVLILGGGDGLALREVLKYHDVKHVVLVDIDPVMTELAKSFYVLLDANRGSMNDPRVVIYNMDAFKFLTLDSSIYDVIIVDLPDPKSVELSKLYSKSFYEMAIKHMSRYGAIVTQSCDVFMENRAFWCINKTMEEAGLSVVPYHNYVPTMGDWGWNLGVKNLKKDEIIKRLKYIDFDNLDTRFIDNNALLSMLNFGRDLTNKEDIEINTVLNPVLQRYYMHGYEMDLD